MTTQDSPVEDPITDSSTAAIAPEPAPRPEVELDFKLRDDPVPSFGFLQQIRGQVFQSSRNLDRFRREVEALGADGEEGRRRGLGLWIVGDYQASADALSAHESDDVASFTRLLRREADGLGIADRFSSQLATWQTLSSERTWSLTETPLRTTGRVAGGWVTLGMVLRNPDPSPTDTNDCFYERRARLRFDEPLGLGLQLRGANTSREWQDRLSDPLGRRTVQTGDAAFDETFAVQADDLEGGKKLLDENVRQMLLKVHQTMDPVWLDDESIELRDPNPETSGDELPRLVPALEELARAMQYARTPTDDRRGGPYR